MLDITTGQKQLLQQLLQHHLPGHEVRAFGSRATGQAKPHSDLDLVVLGDERLPATARADLIEALDQSSLPFRVDVLEWADAPPALREQIHQHAQPI